MHQKSHEILFDKTEIGNLQMFLATGSKISN